MGVDGVVLSFNEAAAPAVHGLEEDIPYFKCRRCLGPQVGQFDEEDEEKSFQYMPTLSANILAMYL